MENPFELIESYLKTIIDKQMALEYKIDRIIQDKDSQLLPYKDLSVDDAVKLSIIQGKPMKKSQIYKHTMLNSDKGSDFPCKRFGKRLVIPREEFIEWLDKKTV
jgi:hypothetical protein